MEKWPLTPEIIKQNINQKAEDLGYEITPEISEILDEIISDLPKNISPRALTVWCNKKVDEAVQSRPDLINESERLRFEVGREIRYVQREESFKVLKKKIIDEDIREVSPAWLENNDRPIHRFVCTFFKKFGSDEVDWDFFARKMDIEDRFKKIRPEIKKGLSFEERVLEIERILEEKNPESFGPRWLFKNCFSEYRYFVKNLESENGVITWLKIINKLPEKWRNRWFVLESKGGFDLDGRIKELISVLEEKDPNSFGPRWIEKNAKSEYRYFTTNLESENGKIKWSEIVDKLPEKFQKKWVYMESRDLTGDNLQLEIISLIKDFRVSSVNPRWIQDNDPTLYVALINRLGRNIYGNIAWERIGEILPAEYVDMFVFERNNFAGFTFVSDLIKKRVKDGQTIDINTIREDIPGLYSFFRRNIRDVKGDISWNFIMKTLFIDYGISVEGQEKFSEKNITYKKMVSRINESCMKLKPRSLSTEFFTKNDPTLNTQVGRFLKDQNGSYNWDFLFEEVDEPYKTMWLIELKTNKKKSKLKLLKILKDY